MALSVRLKDAFRGRTVLVTGHTGFKGAWLALWLRELGADVVGFSLPGEPDGVFMRSGLDALIDSRLGDVRDRDAVSGLLGDVRPELVYHLAAQPLVRRSYADPLETWTTNVVGLVNVLDAVRETASVRACQIITSDKCYESAADGRPHREGDRLGGRDPYSASKACAEIVTFSYRASFFGDRVSIATVRAGNVIGGGDWSSDRIIPDCVRALVRGEPIVVRNPNSVRPWQHVLEPLSGYLALAQRQLLEPARFSQAFNFGPEETESVTVREIVELVIAQWGGGSWTPAPSSDGRETGVLRLDCAKARAELGWAPSYRIVEAIRETVAWYKASLEPSFDATAFTLAQIRSFAERQEAAV